MFKLNFKFAVRNLLKTRLYSGINILSLSIGIMAVILLSSFITEELSFDKFHNHSERIYRFGYQLESENQPTRQLAWVSALVAPEVREKYPEVERVVRVRNCSGTMFGPSNVPYLENKGFFAGDQFFDVFNFAKLSGDLATALDEPYEIVLTRKLAEKYFGDSNPIGEFVRLQIGDTLNLKVSAVIDDVPSNAHFRFDYLISHKTREALYPHIQGWFSLGTHTYFRLREDVNVHQFNDKVESLVMDVYGEEVEKIGFVIKIFTQPLLDIHLKSSLNNEIEANGDITYVYIATGIGGGIFLISLFNFINLFIARSIKFTKQLGVKQVMGANKRHLVAQSITETLLSVAIAFSIAIGLAYVLLPYFEHLVSRELTIEWTGYFSILSLIALTLLAALIAGLYPALIVSSAKVTNSIAGKLSIGKNQTIPRQVLMVLQFGIATVLIIGALVIQRQLNYMLNSPLGFAKENIAVIDLWNNRQIRANTSVFKEKLLQSPSITEVTSSNSVPGEQLLDRVGYPEGDESKSQVMFSLMVQNDFLDLYELDLLEGQNLPVTFNPESDHQFLVNETAVHTFGWNNEEAIGKDFQWGSRSGKIVGVIKDFHYYALREKIPPMIILQTEGGVGYMSIKMEGDIRSAIDYVEEAWIDMYPNQVFDSSFISDRFNNQYQLESQVDQLVQLFTIIAILIACSGLFGLTALQVEQRTKEIGIRKVLGASITSIQLLIGKRFFILIAFSFLVAIPFAYYLSNGWLEDFAFRINLGVDIFIVAAFFTLLTSFATVVVQSYRSAAMNPVKSIRDE